MSINLERKKALKSFSFLWKVNNQEWLNKRKSDWRILQNSIYQNSELGEVKEYMTYFLNGTRNSYIHPSIIYFLTPLNTKEQADEFFFSNVFTDDDRDQITTGGYGMDIDCVDMKSALIVGEHVKNFVEWRRGAGINDVILQDEVCYRADDFIKNYIGHSFYLFLDRANYSPCLDLFDYFMKSLPLLKDADIINSLISSDRINELIDWSKDILDEKEQSTPAMKEHAKQLWDNRERILTIWSEVTL